jgi:hypothetical protein
MQLFSYFWGKMGIRHMGKRITISCFLMFFGVLAYGQTNYRTNLAGGGNWNDPAIWEVETPNGSDIWVAAATFPTSADNTITIRSADILTITEDVTIDQTVFEAGTGVIIDPGITLTVNAGTGTDVTFDPGSAIVVYGRLTVNNSASVVGLDGSAEAFFEDGSFYRHLYATVEGIIPTASWAPGSTLEIFGYTASAANLTFNGPNSVTNWGQSFGNVIIDCPLAALRSVNFDGNLNTIQGDLTITRTSAAGSGRIQLTSATDATVTIAGDLNLAGNGRTYLNENANLTIDIGGNFNITTVNTNASRFTTAGTTTINVSGDFNMNAAGATINMSQGSGPGILNIGGDFSVIAGTLSEASTGFGEINFVSPEPLGQNFVKTGAISNAINYYVAPGSTLNMGDNAATGGGTFIAEGNLRLGNLIGGAIQNSTTVGNIRVPVANRTFTPGITIEYNGTAAQFMGNLFPTDVNVIINNPNGVTLSTGGPVTISTGRDLQINAGSTLAIAANTLTLDGTISGTGTLTGSGTSNLTIGGTGSLGTLRFTTGGQTINNFTINRTGDADLASDLTVTGTLDQIAGNLSITASTLAINGAFNQTIGNDLVVINNPTIVIGGAGALPANTSFGGDLSLTTLTINRAGTFTTNSNLSIVSQLNLQTGTFDNAGAIGMQAGSTLTRTSGTLNNALANFGASQPFNIVYNNGGVMSTGPEIPSVLLDPQNSVLLVNLTKQGSGALTLTSDVEINGIFTLSSGTFAAGTNTILMRGNLVSNAASTLTSSSAQFGGTTVITGSVTPTFGNVSVLTGASVTPNSTFQINGNLVNDGTLNTGSGTTIFGGTTTISGSSISAFNNVTITGTLTSPANSSFRVGGNWINSGTFNASVNSTVEFTGSTTITGTSATNFLHILISGTLTGPTTLNVAGNFTDNGTFTAGSNTVVFNGTSIQNLQGTSVTVFNNINVTNTTGGPPGVRIESNKNIRGTLSLSPGATFDADGSAGTAIFTLLSTDDDPAVDAAIAALSGGAQVTGNVTVQRYMSIEGGSNSPTFNNGRIYRYISSPVSNASVSQLQTEIPVTGSFTGTSVCSGCGTTQSMFAYNESVTTDTNGSGSNTVDDGYIDFPNASNTEILTPGRGYTIFVRGNIAPVSTNGHARWDVRNPINSGTVSFNSHVTYTSSGNNASDGWNMVGNPYPSTIDWNAATGWTKTGLNNTIYMRDNASNPIVYATFNGTVGTNGGSRYIPMGQAFFVKSDGGPIDFQATEDVKAPGNPAIFFREPAPTNVLRIALRRGDVRDEVVVHLRDGASDGYDSKMDAYKLKNSSFNLATFIEGGTQLAINSMSQEIGCGKVVNLDISEVEAGSYELFFSDFESFAANSLITLRDAFADKTVAVRSTNSYTFDVTADPASFGAQRFSVIISPAPVTDMAVTAPASVCASDDVKITIPATEKGYRYSVIAQGESVLNVDGTGKSLDLIVPRQKLTLGRNTLKVEAQSNLCPNVKISGLAIVSVEEVQQAAIEVIDENTLASNYSTGNVWYLNGNQISNYSGQFLDVTESGLYTLKVNAGSCVSLAEREFVYSVTEDGGVTVAVFPNPVKGGEMLTVRSKNPDLTRVSITNSVGVEIGVVILETDESGEPGTYVGKFDIRQFPSGLYFVKVRDGDKFRVIKIISL